ncbi:gluconolaconase [Sphingomonas sp. ABOLD]|uniref:glycosyl hydrolase family 28-related protein n=1 Tax=unclassified Sphingomonas TaxID=196159 RepID=UPI000F7DC04F|nr:MULTISPECIES: glycosyl hydrolase family 28-related protein [unclassified Sphingomonas]RSV39617.1 gluconolaconase [Sphingomonas sp. ABOLE]RSV47682.1 gluconolaconase [Sphingomonas sp. ABOLD]
MDMRCFLAGLLVATSLTAPAVAQHASVFPTAPDEPRAVTVKARGDGKTDDTAAIQKALDEARDASRHGIVFLPSGRYRISRTLVVPAGVRVYGVGPTRPTILLGASTPGFQQGVSTMIVFGGDDQYAVGKVPVPVPNIVPREKIVRDANSGTFYSSMSNVDIEIAEGNPAAAGVRFRMAQHAFLSHMEFRLGSAFAGVYQAGNVIEKVAFKGGRYGIVTEKTSPAWQFTLIDAQFDGQREAAIREHEVDLTLVNVAIRDTPVGIEIDRGYSDSLWGKDVRFERVSKAAVVISNEDSAFTQVGFDNAVAIDSPIFARFRDSGKTVAGKGRAYRVGAFSYGLKVPKLGEMGKTDLQAEIQPLASAPARPALAVRALPPMAEWVNVRTLGVKGDGTTDDTAALQKAIDGNRVLYLPVGFYKVTDRLKLRPDSVLIGLHPATTQLYIPDDNPAHRGLGTVIPILETPQGGDNILSGLGLFTGRVNPRASAVLWRSGANSLMQDVKIMGGGGTPTADGKPLGSLQGRTGDPVAEGRWDAQYPSIWVTDNGGGTFTDVWSPNTFAQAGFYVTNTSTPGHVYEMSVEHHVRNEFVLDNVQNWEFLAPQTEQEVGDGPDAVSLEIRNSRNLLFANYHGYRVTRSYHPAKSAVKLFNSSDIRFRNVHVNAESGYAACDDEGCGTFLRVSKYPFDNAIEDVTGKKLVREREFARLDVGATERQVAEKPASGKVEKLEDGFYSISGAAVDPQGRLYFIDRRFQRIQRWTEAKGLEIIRDHALDPVNLAVDASGHLLVLSSLGPKGAVYSIDPDGPRDQLTRIEPTPIGAGAGAKTLLPVNWWANGEFRDQLNQQTYQFTTMAELFAKEAMEPKTRAYVSPDGSVALPAFRVWQQGPIDHVGWRWSHALNANGLISGKQGERVFVTNGSENITYTGTVGPSGTLTNLKPFANRGGESVAVAPDGRVYVANGQVFVYGADGKEVGRIDVPERPLQILFGGADKRTLFILTHHALYATRP